MNLILHPVNINQDQYRTLNSILNNSNTTIALIFVKVILDKPSQIIRPFIFKTGELG